MKASTADFCYELNSSFFGLFPSCKKGLYFVESSIQLKVSTDLLDCSFIVPTFDTKVTEYCARGGFFFLQTNFDFLTSHF